MKKLPLIAFLTGSLLIASIATTAISLLSKLTIKPEGLDLDQLMHGQVLQLVLTKEFWSLYPSLPGIPLLFSPNEFLLMGFISAGIIYFLAYRRKTDPAMVCFGLLLTGILPYGLGLIALATNAKPEEAGPWISFMLAGVLYSAMASALFSSIKLWKNNSPLRPRFSRT